MEARKMGLLGQPADFLKLIHAPLDREISMEDEIDRPTHGSGGPAAIKEQDGVWRAGRGFNHKSDYPEEEDNRASEPISFGDLHRPGTDRNAQATGGFLSCDRAHQQQHPTSCTSTSRPPFARTGKTGRFGGLRRMEPSRTSLPSGGSEP
jgi:hypothetical protein